VMDGIICWVVRQESSPESTLSTSSSWGHEEPCAIFETNCTSGSRRKIGIVSFVVAVCMACEAFSHMIKELYFVLMLSIDIQK
jgi:hypothetical protein